MYTFMGAFAPMRRLVSKLLKEKGYNTREEKRAYIESVLGESLPMTRMTISQLEQIINSLS